MLHLLGFDHGTPGKPGHSPFGSKLTEAEKTIVSGLMKRLFGQLPAYEPGRMGEER